MDTIKSLTITGAAAQDAMKPRRSTSRKKQPLGSEDDTQMPPSEFPVLPPRVLPRQPPIKPPVVQPLEQPPQQSAQVIVQEAGSVILKPPKVQRVKLQPKIPIKAHSHPIIATTRKARRIHLTSTSLTNRFTRAKKVRDDTGAKPMTHIRDFLIHKGVIQLKSKAPEKMLRSMYSDFMLLKDQAL